MDQRSSYSSRFTISEVNVGKNIAKGANLAINYVAFYTLNFPSFSFKVVGSLKGESRQAFLSAYNPK